MRRWGNHNEKEAFYPPISVLCIFSEPFISKVLDSIGGTLEDLLGCLNFIYDYWFNGDSPLPYEARY